MEESRVDMTLNHVGRWGGKARGETKGTGRAAARRPKVQRGQVTKMDGLYRKNL